MKLQELQKQLKSIELTFPKPVNGFWDNGSRSGGVFEPTIMKGGYNCDNGQKKYQNLKWHVKWDCWELNYWFRTPSPKETDIVKAAQAILNSTKRKIRKDCRVRGCKLKLVNNS
jgi:hypothetical protein